MRNKISILTVVTFLLFAVLGCSGLNPFAVERESQTGTQKEKTVKDKAVDVAVGEKKIGIPECDEVMDAITIEMNNPDDDVITKTVKATVLNRIKDGIRESVEKNASDTTELVKTCKEFKIQLDKYKTEQAEKEAR